MRPVRLDTGPMERQRELLCFGLEPEAYSWRGVGLLVSVYFGAMLFAALVAPFVFQAARWWLEVSPNTVPDALATRMEPSDFPRWFDRLRWLPVLLALPWLLQVTGLFSLSKLWGRPGQGQQLWPALVLGIGMLLPVIFIQLLAGNLSSAQLSLKPSTSESLLLGVILSVSSALLSAALIAFLEETVFRGLVFRLFYAAVKPWLAIGLSSGFFAMAHFDHVSWQPDGPVSLKDGLLVGAQVAWAPFKEGFSFAFLNLFLAGVVLALVFQRYRSLWPCVGLHAGWVITRMVYADHVQFQPQWQWLLGSQQLIDGLLPTLIMIAVIAWLAHKTRFD